MNNLTGFGGGSVLPSLAAVKKELKPLEIIQGLFSFPQWVY
jgi:hypothetical protein